MYQVIQKLSYPRRIILEKLELRRSGKRTRIWIGRLHSSDFCLFSSASVQSTTTIGTIIRSNDDEKQKDSFGTTNLAVTQFTEEPNEIVKVIADAIRESVRTYTSHHELNLIGISTSKSLLQQYHHPNDDTDELDTSIQMHVNEGIESYSNSVSKSCREDGINYNLWRVPGGFNIVQQVDNLIQRANHMPNVHGVLVYYPLLSSKPEALGWDIYDDDDDDDDDDNDNNKKNGSTYDSLDSYGDRKWTVEQQERNIQKGCEEILQNHQKCIPGLTFKTRDDHYRNLIQHQRDVEGLSSYHRIQTKFLNKSAENCTTGTTPGIIVPCTPLAVMKILDHILEEESSNHQVTERINTPNLLGGRIVTIINRSETFGRPLASMLANHGANVFSIDESSILQYNKGKIRRLSLLSPSSNNSSDEVQNHSTRTQRMDVEQCVRNSSILVTAVPSSAYKVPTGWIQPNTIVVNVASEPNINEEEIIDVPGVTYFPQIGKVTVSLLEHNLMTLHQHQVLGKF